MELHRSSFNLDLFLKSDEESHEAQKSNESKQKLFCSTFFYQRLIMFSLEEKTIESPFTQRNKKGLEGSERSIQVAKEELNIKELSN